jgi:hypothetical protein
VSEAFLVTRRYRLEVWVFTLPVQDFFMFLGWFDEVSICSTVAG